MPTTVATPDVEPARVDEAIHSMEKLYRAVTGQEPPAGGAARSSIPVEKDPGQFVHEQLDRLLGLLEQPAWSAPSAPLLTWAPLVSLYEEDKEWILQADLPGVERKDLEVTLAENVITLRGQRLPALKTRPRIGERLTGAFLRRVALPPRQQFGEPKARLRDGVLEVRLEKTSASQANPRPIAVD